MKAKQIISITLAILILLSFAGCNKSSDKSNDKSVSTSETSKEKDKKKDSKKENKKDKDEDKDNEKKTSKKIDSGSWEDNIYTNDFLGLTLTIPEDWYIASEKELKKAINAGEDIMTSGNEDKEDLIKDAVSKTTYLFLISEKDLNKTYESNANIIAMAENMNLLPNVNDVDDYLEALIKGFEVFYNNIPYEDDKPITTKKIGGQEFSILELTANYDNFTINQKYYITQIDDYVLSFTTTAMNEEESEQLDKIMKSISFE